MCKCKYCGKKVKKTPGYKERKYCNASCRQKHWQQKKREGKGIVKITQEEYLKLINNAGGKIPETVKVGDINQISVEENKRFKIVNGKKVFK